MSNQIDFTVESLEDVNDMRGGVFCTFRHGPRWASVRVGQVLDYVARTEDRKDIAAGKLAVTDIVYGPLGELGSHFDRYHRNNKITVHHRNHDDESTIAVKSSDDVSVYTEWADVRTDLFKTYGKEKVRNTSMYTVLYFVVLED